MILYTVGIISTCFMIGYQGGQIRSWANTTDNRITKVEEWQANKDREEHERALKKIYSCTFPYFNLNDMGIGEPICNENYLATNP